MRVDPLKPARRFEAAPGIRVITERHPGILSSAVGIFVGCGSRHESQQLHGATHLSEHLFFKGTSARSAEDISELLERHGGDLNAFTDRELTAFHAWIPAERLGLALDLLFEMLFDSLFDPQEFERERHVVLQELRSYGDNPDEEFGDRVLEVALAEHPLGRRIAGFPKAVAKLSCDDVVNYIADYFLRSPIVVSVVSPLPDAKVEELVRKSLAKAERWRWGHLIGKPVRRIPKSTPELPENFSRRSKLERFDADQVQFSFMFRGVSTKHKDEVLWTALSNLLGGGSSSRLFREVRERRGLAYTTQAQLYSYSDVGILGGYLATDPKKFIEAVQVAGETCRNMAETITDDDLDFVKSMMEGYVSMGYDGINNRMESLARQELLLHEAYTFRQALKDVRAITRPRLERAARALTETPCFYALGPVSQRQLSRIERAWRGKS